MRSSSPGGAEAARQNNEIPSPLPLIHFHSSFWVNLHHFLYQQALIGAGNARASQVASPDPATSRLAGKQQQAWSSAVTYYRDHIISRDLLWDENLAADNARLADIGELADLSGRGLEPGLGPVLEMAAPVYRQVWWTGHDGANRKWAAEVAPLMERFGNEVETRLAGIYDAEWPAGGARVEIVSYANWAGAYTTGHPYLITVSSTDSANRGYTGLENLFHEASHGLDYVEQPRLARECDSQHRETPPDLWHSVIFYTTGEVIRQTLARHGIAPYTPYAYKYTLYERGWTGYLKGLETIWQSHIDGKTNFRTALAGLVAAVTEPKSNSDKAAGGRFR